MNTFDAKNPPFNRLTHEGQVLLAAWAVLAMSEPLSNGEQIPAGYSLALHELAGRPSWRPRTSRQLAPSNRKRKPRIDWRVTT
jgi:hypothetical protein